MSYVPSLIQEESISHKHRKYNYGSSIKSINIPNHPTHAADVQTQREGDFSIADVIYHVTATPGKSIIEKCADNLRAGKCPILLVPAAHKDKALALAQEKGIHGYVAVFGIEDFVALNVIELAAEENKEFHAIIDDIIQIFNRRVREVETSVTLQIEMS